MSLHLPGGKALAAVGVRGWWAVTGFTMLCFMLGMAVFTYAWLGKGDVTAREAVFSGWVLICGAVGTLLGAGVHASGQTGGSANGGTSSG